MYGRRHSVPFLRGDQRLAMRNPICVANSERQVSNSSGPLRKITKAQAMPWTEQLANPDELRRCIRDLVALSTLRAAWRNYDMRQIGDSIVAALVTMLAADFIFMALPSHGDQFTELARSDPTLTPASLDHV